MAEPARPTSTAALAASKRPRHDEPPVSITQPDALKALAHPARQRIIDLLHDHDGPLTATQMAEACGLTPSAMSYHLRALERWGIVAREESEDGRERPWRAIGSSLDVGPEAFAGVSHADMTAYLAAFLAPLSEAATRFAGELAGRDPASPTADRGMMHRSRLWLTPAEYRDLTRRLRAAEEPFRDRSAEDHPEDAGPYDVYAIALPLDDGRPRA